MTTFIGLDLAWTSHRETGIWWFEGDELDTLMWRPPRGGGVQGRGPGPRFQGRLSLPSTRPLIVTRRRRVEREIGRRFGRYKASAHNLDLLRRTGRTAGMDLGQALERRGIVLDPTALLGLNGPSVHIWTS